jgi:hypothetical protein
MRAASQDHRHRSPPLCALAGAAAEGSDDDDEAAVRDIIAQAVDEARLGLGGKPRGEHHADSGGSEAGSSDANEDAASVPGSEEDEDD